MAIQTRYSKNGHSFDCADHITPEFQSAYDYVAEHYPVLVYPIEYGVKQSTSDAYAGKTLHNEIEGAGVKKFIAIMKGMVRVAGSGERTPTKTPMEREVWRIAAGELADIFTKKKVPKDRQAAYIKMLVTRDWERLEDEARVNLEATASLSETTFDLLDDLFSAMDEDDDEAEAAE
jgi:hypothetical protein